MGWKQGVCHYKKNILKASATGGLQCFIYDRSSLAVAPPPPATSQGAPVLAANESVQLRAANHSDPLPAANHIDPPPATSQGAPVLATNESAPLRAANYSAPLLAANQRTPPAVMLKQLSLSSLLSLLVPGTGPR